MKPVKNPRKLFHIYFIVSFIIILSVLFLSGNLLAQDGPKHLNHPNLNTWRPQLLTGQQFDNFGVTRTDFTITMSDGVTIDALKFVPVGTAPTGGWPTVIMVHGYGDNKNTLAGFCQAQAEYGYYTMTFSVRGQGLSGGLSNLISRTEMNDMIQIVNWVKGDSVNGSNPNNILIMGGSQGGALPYMAACSGMNVKTIISSVAPPNFASSWIENGCIKMTFLWTIDYTPDTARYNSQVNAMRSWVYANNKVKWDSLAYWLPRERDFMTLVPNCHVPIMIEGSWQDKFFNADGMIQGINLLTCPYTSYIGAVQGHGGDHSVTEDNWHMQLFNDWFFQFLWNMPTGVLTMPKYQYASTTYPRANNYWSFVHDSSTFPLPQIVTNAKVYFNRNNRLSLSPQNGNDKITLRNQVNGSLTMQDAVYSEFKGTTFNSKFVKNSIYLESDPLTFDVEMTGTPKVNIEYKASGNTFCQYNFQIFERMPNGTMDFVNRINYTDRNYNANSRRTANFKGQAHSHIFKTGNRIRLVITNFDWAPSDSTFLGSNPFVLPVLINSNNDIYLNNASYIELPIRLNGTGRTSEIFDENLTENNQPGEYSLSQNYPNPFNPSTTIQYTIGASNLVQIKIYDMTGREVTTLLNEFRQAGSYSVDFNASNLASGVYFYKIVSGSFWDIKKMILVK